MPSSEETSHKPHLQPEAREANLTSLKGPQLRKLPQNLPRVASSHRLESALSPCLARVLLARRAINSGSTPPRNPIATVSPTKATTHPAIRHQARSVGVSLRGTTRNITPRAAGAAKAKLLRMILRVECGCACARLRHLRPITRIATAATVPAIGDAAAQNNTARRLTASPFRAGIMATDQTKSSVLSPRPSTNVRLNSFKVLTVLLRFTSLEERCSALDQQSPTFGGARSGMPPSRGHHQCKMVHNVESWPPIMKTPP